MDMCAPLCQPLIICYFLWVSVWVCTCVQACVLLRVCDRDIPAAETWEGVTYETLDSSLSADWGVLKCQNSNFLQTVTHTLTLCISLTQPNTLCCHHSYLPELSLPSHLSFIYKHSLSHFLSVPFLWYHKEKSCLTPLYHAVTPPPPICSLPQTNTHPFSSHRASGKIKRGGKVEREKEREEFENRGPLLLSGDAPAHP